MGNFVRRGHLVEATEKDDAGYTRACASINQAKRYSRWLQDRGHVVTVVHNRSRRVHRLQGAAGASFNYRDTWR